MSDNFEEEVKKEYNKIVEKVKNMSKEDMVKSNEELIAYLKNVQEQIRESINYTGEEIDFECACVDGDFIKVEQMLKNIPYLTIDLSYIKDQIEYVEEEIELNGTTEGLVKVLEILKTEYLWNCPISECPD